jgi:hypothetical protein
MFNTTYINDMNKEEIKTKIYDLIEFHFCPIIKNL